jgi:hypothetical protein
MEEERWSCFVALTRTKECLVLNRRTKSQGLAERTIKVLWGRGNLYRTIWVAKSYVVRLKSWSQLQGVCLTLRCDVSHCGTGTSPQKMQKEGLRLSGRSRLCSPEPQGQSRSPLKQDPER